MRRVRTTVASVLCATTAAAATIVPLEKSCAQSDALEVEEVVVTARKREERLQDVPTTLQVFSGSELTRNGVRDFSQIQQSVPNFIFASDRAARSVFTLRGFGATTTTNLAPGVGIYVDGVYQPSTAFFNAPLVDLERLEFLKGPQGTLFGRNAYAGAINIVTRVPNDQMQVHAQVEAANGDTQRVFTSISGPLVEGRLRGLISAGVQQQEGFFKYAATGSPVDPHDYLVTRARLVLDVTQSLSIDMTGQYFDLDTGGFKYHAVQGVEDDRENIRLNEPQHEQAQFTDIWINTKWSLAAVDLIGITSYSDQTNDSLLDGDIGSNLLISSARVNERKIWSQELRAQSRGEGRFNWLFGAYYSKSELRSGQVNSGGFFPAGALRTAGGEDAEIRALFTDLTYALTDRLELGVGVRYDEIDKQGRSGNVLLTPAGPVQLSATAIDGEYHAPQPKASLRYAIADDLNIYATFAKGFREGGLNLNAPGTPVQSFDSDEIKSYEVGLKSTWAGGRIGLNVAGFFMEAPSYNSDSVYVNPLGGATLVTVNVGVAESYGLEADLVARLSDAWSLSAGVGYVEATWTKITSATIRARPGDALLMTPKWSANLSARGKFPLRASGFKLEVIGAVTAKDESVLSYDAVVGPYVRDAYVLFDLSVGLVGERWRAAVFGRNLSDERFPEIFNQAALLAPFGATDDVSLFNQPRMYGVRLEYHY